MKYTLIDIITHTPIWVWFVLGLLIYLGIRQLSTRPVNPIRILIFPLIFLPLTLISFKQSPNFMLSLLVFMVCLVAGFAVARPYFVKNPLIIYHQEHHCWIQQKSYLPLLLYMAIFICRYVLSVVFAIRLPIIQTHLFAILLGLPIGLGLGIMIAMYPKPIFSLKQ